MILVEQVNKIAVRIPLRFVETRSATSVHRLPVRIITGVPLARTLPGNLRLGPEQNDLFCLVCVASQQEHASAHHGIARIELRHAISEKLTSNIRWNLPVQIGCLNAIEVALVSLKIPL